MARPVKDGVQSFLRLPVDLRKAVEHAAKRHKRSFNAEVISRLQATVRAEQFPNQEAHRLIDQAIQQALASANAIPPGVVKLRESTDALAEAIRR